MMESAELEKYRALLDAEHTEVRHQLEESGANPDAESIDGMDLDFGFADSAQATAERSRVIALVETLRERLVDIDIAIGKLDTSAFGLCEICSEPIPSERLEAIPHVRLCASCKSKG